MADETPAAAPTAVDSRDLDALRTLLLHLIEAGEGEEAVALVIRLLTQIHGENVALQHRLHLALRALYGRKSEKLSDADKARIKKAIEEAVVPNDTTPSNTASDATTPGTPDAPPKEKKKLPPDVAHGRGERPTHLPTKTTESRVPDSQRTCPKCSDALFPLKPKDSWYVDYEPGHFTVHVTECEQLSCRRCRDVIVTAPAPPKVIEGGIPGSGLLAKVLVDKGADHLPIERQQRRLAREGLDVPITTLAGWWAQGADLLLPIYNTLSHVALNAWLPQIDATGLKVLDRDHPKGIRLGHIWTAVGGPAVAFHFTPTKGAGLDSVLVKRGLSQHAATGSDKRSNEAQESGDAYVTNRADEKPHNTDDGEDDADDDLNDRDGAPIDAKSLREIGPLQCDGEGIYSRLHSKLGLVAVLVHCWMHARRYFERATNAKDLRARVAMDLISRMYAIEARATAEGVSDEERTRRRQTETWPLLEQLREWCLSIRALAVPGSPLGRALKYLERRWFSLCVFVLDGRIPIDNGEVERVIRPVGVGRHNWLFTGSDEAAVRLCIVASVCATCRRVKVDPWEYLRDVYDAIARGVSARQLALDWTPWAWAEKKAQNANAQQTVTA